MAAEWPLRKLADVCDSVDYGYTASAVNAAGGPKFLRITDIVPGYVDWNSVPYCEIDDSLADKYRLNDGDVVIARTGATTGYSVYIAHPPNAVFASYLVRLKTGDEADSRFVSYFLKSLHFWNYMRGVLGEKSAQPNASAKTMTQVKLLLPPVKEQKGIARILATLDDKIDLNRRINETLEAIARAIFKSWFVDFDPVRAKTNGCQPAGMDAETAALFPDSFMETTIGKVPKGWSVDKVGEICDFDYGKALKAANRIPGDVPVYGSNGQVGWHDERLVKGPGIVVGRKGNPGIVVWAQDDFYPIDTTFYITLRGADCTLDYMFYALENMDLPSLGADSAVPGLNRNMAYMSDMVVPPKQLTNAFSAKRQTLLRRIQLNVQQNRTMAGIRDTLIPKLISGEIRVKDAEKFVEEHAG